VLIDGTMYVTTATNTYAIDARTAQQRWSHHFNAKSMGLGTPVRGVKVRALAEEFPEMPVQMRASFGV